MHNISLGFVQNVMLNIEERAASNMERTQLSEKTKQKAKEFLTLLEVEQITLPSVFYPSINEDGTLDLIVKVKHVEWTISILEDHVNIFKLQNDDVQMHTNLIPTGENYTNSICEIKEIFLIA